MFTCSFKSYFESRNDVYSFTNLSEFAQDFPSFKLWRLWNTLSDAQAGMAGQPIHSVSKRTKNKSRWEMVRMEGCCPNLPPRSKHCFPGHVEHISGTVFTVYSFFCIYNLWLFLTIAIYYILNIIVMMIIIFIYSQVARSWNHFCWSEPFSHTWSHLNSSHHAERWTGQRSGAKAAPTFKGTSRPESRISDSLSSDFYWSFLFPLGHPGTDPSLP